MPIHLQILLPLLTLALGHATGHISPLGLALGVAYAGWVLAAKRVPNWLWLPVTLLASVALAAHLVPGFAYLSLTEPTPWSPDAPPYALRVNWDKALVGMSLLAWWLGRPDPVPTARRSATLAVMLATLVAVPVLALALGLVGWVPKWPEHLALWLAVNLLVTVLAEELVFRALLQRTLAARLGPWAGLLLATLLFGAVHLPFSTLFAVVATVAGLGYGLAFHFSGRLGPAVALHLGVNLCHVLLLSYPLKLG